MKLYIVEDDLTLAVELVRLCGRWGFEAVHALRFREIQEEFQEVRPDLVLMDINLPFYDGFYWCEKIREISRVPVLFLSSRDQNADKIMGMAAGGDDYMEKPFDPELLLVKIRSMLRRAYEYRESQRTVLAEQVFLEDGVVYGPDHKEELTPSERKIMEVLIRERGRTVTREELMQVLWNTDEFVTDASLTVLVSRLRARLARVAGDRELIGTKKGTGYYIR